MELLSGASFWEVCIVSRLRQEVQAKCNTALVLQAACLPGSPCSECAKHFVRYASAEEALKVRSKKEAMMWMWVAHNKASRVGWPGR
jgi:hypothetical protein